MSGGVVPAGRLLPLRPMSIGDVLDGAFRALRATFATAALLVLLVQGPYQLLSSLAFARLLPELGDAVDLERAIEDPSAGLGLALRAASVVTLSSLVGLVVNVVLAAAIVWCVLRVDRGQAATVGGALRTAVGRMGATLGGSLLVLFAGGSLLGLGLLVLTLLVVVAPPVGLVTLLVAAPVAFLVLAAVLYLVPAVAVVEARGPLATIGRCLWVLGRRFWRVLSVTLLVSLLLAAITLGLSLAMALLAGLAGPAGWIVEAVASTVVALVSVPVTAIAALLVYLDARIRLEGLDLELRSRGVGTV